MSVETVRPLSLLHVDFDGLYVRHLGRHSQFGINVNHLLALFNYGGVAGAMLGAVFITPWGSRVAMLAMSTLAVGVGLVLAQTEIVPPASSALLAMVSAGLGPERMARRGRASPDGSGRWSASPGRRRTSPRTARARSRLCRSSR